MSQGRGTGYPSGHVPWAAGGPAQHTNTIPWRLAHAPRHRRRCRAACSPPHAGKLPLASLLRLEAAVAASGGADLLPPGGAEAALRLCCALCLEPGADAELGGLLQPLAGSGGSGGGGGGSAAEEVTVPDTDEEEEGAALLPAAAVAGASGGHGAAVDELAAAVAAALGSSSSSGHGAQPSAALRVCQCASAHMLRLLASQPGAPGLSQLLGELLCGLVARCFQQQGSVGAVTGAAGWQQQLAAGPPAGQLSQRLPPLAAGRALELLPQPLGAGWERQRRQLAALAQALEWALSDAGLNAGPAAIRRRVQAALAMP